MAESNSRLVLTERDDDVTTIRLNRPDKLNAVNDPLLEELAAALEAVNDDPSGALLLAGAGRATCAGRDQETVSDPDYERHPLTYEVPELIRSYPNPTALAGKGAVVGMAFGFALSCDFVVLGEETHYSYPEVQYGIDTSDSFERLSEYVGPGVAKELIMSGEPIDPEHARQLGLVNHVTPNDAVEERARELLNGVMAHDRDVIEKMVSVSRLER